MKLSDNNIKLIFGLKLKQLRQDRGLSLVELAQKSSLSISYLNEIENGKKYPKSDKIALLANALQVSYDKLVSLKLTKNLIPIGELLQSNLLEQLPLDHYGIDVNKLLLQISQAPLQLSALVSTLIEMGKSFELSQNNFSKTALQTYNELNENYFSDLEDSVDEFNKQYGLTTASSVNLETLSKILSEEFGFKIDENSLQEYPELSFVRGVSISNEHIKKILLNRRLSPSQKSFIIAKEIAYIYLKIKDRSNIYSDMSLSSFDQLLNNFRASYFATALIIRRNSLIDDLNNFFAHDKWHSEIFIFLLEKYNATPEMFLQRITNLLSKYFGITSFFFLRFNSKSGSGSYKLSKEIKLNISENPGGYQTNENFCRRWISIKAIKMLEEFQVGPDNHSTPLALIQKSTFINTKNEFLTIAVAKKSTLLENTNFGIMIGILINDEVKNKINFCNDPEIPTNVVNETCERCQIMDCKDRVSQPSTLEKKIRNENLEKALQKLIESVKD